MELTKEFVNSCRKVGVLRDFLCQAIDQVDEKDKEIADLKKACNDKDDWCLHTLKELRRQKYKRCMNNAWWCLREEFFAEDCHCEHWVDWAIKWYKRWLAIAEKFKPNSTAQ